MKDTVKLLYISSYAWSDLWRRKQRLADGLAGREGVSGALYVNPPVETSVLDLVRGRFTPSHLEPSRRAHLNALLGRPIRQDHSAWLYTGSTKTLPLSRLDWVRKIDLLNHYNSWAYVHQMRRCLDTLPGDRYVLWLSNPMQAEVLDAFRDRCLLCYDWTDDWSEFELLPVTDRNELDRRNERIIRAADIVFAVSTNLYERALALNPSTYHMPNATDFPTLNRPAPLADEVARIPGPRLGYVGQIGDRVDFDLIESVARARPEWSLVFVGPVWENRREAVAHLQTLPNVYFLGPWPYDRLNEIFQGVDVCLIPHTVDRLTASMDPVKLYDYLATGKPIVTTPVAGVERFPDAVYVARTPDEFVARVSEGLGEIGSELTERRRRYGLANSWKSRVDQVWNIINGKLGGGLLPSPSIPTGTNRLNLRADNRGSR